MAFHIFRYAWTSIDVPGSINRMIDPAFPASFVKQWNNAVIDLSGDDSTKPDLDDVMADLGWTFVGTDLPGPPKTVGGDNIRGRRNMMSEGMRSLPATSPPAFFAAGQPRDLALVAPSRAWAAGVQPAGNFLAIADNSVIGQPLTVIDKISGVLIQLLPLVPLALGVGWNRIAYVGGLGTSPASEKVVLMQTTTGNIVMIDLITGNQFSSAAVPAGGSHLYFDGGALYVVAGDGSLRMANEPSGLGLGAMTAVQPAGTFDTNCQYMVADEQFLYIPQPTSNRIARVGPGYSIAGAPVAFFNDFGGVLSPQTPTGIAYDGRFLWVTLPGQGALVQLDPSSPILPTIRVQAVGNAGDGAHAVVFDGDSLWISLPNVVLPVNAGLSRIDPDRAISAVGGELGRVTGFSAATELAVRGTPNGAQVYVLSTVDNAVRVIKNEPFQ